MTPGVSDMPDVLDLNIRRVDPVADPRAPDPVSLLSDGFWTKVVERRERRRRQRRRRMAALGSVAVVALAVGLVLGLAPVGIGPSGETAAAAALQTIADHAGQSVTYPGSGTWLHRTIHFSITSPTTTTKTSVSQTTTIIGVKASPAHSVIISGVLDTWVNGTEACQSPTFDPAQFGSPDRQAAWEAVGLGLSPEPGLHGDCTTAIGPTLHAGTHLTRVLSNGVLPIDVSGLPADPAKLATALKTGKTGVPSLDRGVSNRSAQAPFERAVLLLLAPTVGASPQFPSEVYRAIALLPNVVPLGAVSTHTGKTGEGFAASRGSDAAAIVVSRKGTLLEVRNFESGAWRGRWAELVVTSFSVTAVKARAFADPPLVYQLWFTTDWLDPDGPPSAVDKATVPNLRLQALL